MTLKRTGEEMEEQQRKNIIKNKEANATREEGKGHRGLELARGAKEAA